jgi:opacity protein-like surface antigen
MRALLVVALLAVSAVSIAEPRPGTMEFTVGAMNTLSTSTDGENGSSLSLDSTIGFQGGFDYYFTNRISAGFDFSWASPDYDVQLVPENPALPVINASAEADMFIGQFNAAYNFMDGPFTPFAEASLGWTYFDSNIVDGAPVTGCWWDPWWGYICADFYDTYDETSFSYGLSLGARYDFANDVFVKAAYRWLDVDTDGSDPDLESVSLEIGWRF